MSEALGGSFLAQQVRELPPLPQALREVMQALQHENLSANRSIELIEHDQALAARTLRIANSAFYGAPGRVARVGDAVRMLGLRTVSGVMTAAVLRGSLRVERCPEFHFDGYWRHAIGTALAAQMLAPGAGLDADEAFIGGLLHDIGQLVLAAHYPEQARQSLIKARKDDLFSEQAELAVFGLGHSTIGSMVAQHWRFPTVICQAIALHHAPEPAPAGQRLSLSGLVHVADAVAHALDLSQADDEAVPPLQPAVWQALGWNQAAALRLFSDVVAGVHELSEAMQG
jgi:putative nucleotidyltransferase with HDIG domain